MKRCGGILCLGSWRPLGAFSRSKRNRDGLATQCKACGQVNNRAWRLANPEKKRAAERAWRLANPEKKRASNKSWAAANPEKAKASIKAWQLANPERTKANNRTWRKNNPDKAKARDRKYYALDPDKAKARSRNWYRANTKKSNATKRVWQKQKITKDSVYRLTHNLRTQIGNGLAGSRKSKHTHEYLCCSFADFMIYLGAMFEVGMTTDNYCHFWQVDHIVPVTAFKTMDAEEMKICWHYTNFQPLTIKENRYWMNKVFKGGRWKPRFPDHLKPFVVDGYYTYDPEHFKASNVL